MMISVSVDDDTYRRLKRIESITGRSVDDLAYAAVSSEAIRYFRDRDDDPVKRRP